jgi:hypothetical protein
LRGYPQRISSTELESGILKPLALQEGCVREIPLYLIFANQEFAGPGENASLKLLKEMH